MVPQCTTLTTSIAVAGMILASATLSVAQDAPAIEFTFKDSSYDSDGYFHDTHHALSCSGNMTTNMNRIPEPAEYNIQSVSIEINEPSCSLVVGCEQADTDTDDFLAGWDSTLGYAEIKDWTDHNVFGNYMEVCGEEWDVEKNAKRYDDGRAGYVTHYYAWCLCED